MFTSFLHCCVRDIASMRVWGALLVVYIKYAQEKAFMTEKRFAIFKKRVYYGVRKGGGTGT